MVTYKQSVVNSDKTVFLLIDKITQSNINIIKEYIQSATLIISDKLSLPSPNDIEKQNISGNRTKYINLESLRTSVLNHTNKTLLNETIFNNFRAKAIYWEEQLSKSIFEPFENDVPQTIIINYTPSKHEVQFFKLMYQVGINIVIISKDIFTFDISDMPSESSVLQYTSKQGEQEQTLDIIQYYNNIHAGTQQILNELSVSNTSIAKIKEMFTPTNTGDIEQAIFNENKTIKVNVSGIVNYIDACNFYGRTYKECNNNPNKYVLVQNEFRVTSVEQTQRIPRFANLKYDYLINTLPNFIECVNPDILNQLKIGFKQSFSRDSFKQLNGSVLYNKMVKVVCTLNNLVSNPDIKLIAFYGIISDSSKLIFEILKEIENLSILIMCPDKSIDNRIDGIYTLELPNSTEMFDMPTIDKRSSATTLAAAVQGRVNETLYSGDTLGMYKPGQFRYAKTIPFVTTYDEIEMWWNKPLYLRPGFEATGDTAIIPTMFKVVKGVLFDRNEYILKIRRLCCGRTIAATSEQELAFRFINNATNVRVLHGVDVNGTLYKDQVPLYDNNYKLNIKNVKHDKNYQYGILSDNKQDLILSAINQIITSDTISWQKDFRTKEEFVTIALNTLLNLSGLIIATIQWFEFYTYNPNIVLFLNSNSVITSQTAIILEFARLIGFDIVIFVPSGYLLVEQKLQNSVPMDIYNIGETTNQVFIDRLIVTDNIEIPNQSYESSNNSSKKKKGFFSKLFE
jgi:hypothetical protein